MQKLNNEIRKAIGAKFNTFSSAYITFCFLFPSYLNLCSNRTYLTIQAVLGFLVNLPFSRIFIAFATILIYYFSSEPTPLCARFTAKLEYSVKNHESKKFFQSSRQFYIFLFLLSKRAHVKETTLFSSWQRMKADVS